MRVKMHDETTRLVRRDGEESNVGFRSYEGVDNYYNLGDKQQHEDAEENEDRSNRYKNLALIALTTPGVKFFKSAQSSFQEYLMTDRELQMSATTYGVLLTLISMPIVPLLGGALLDYKRGGDGHHHRHHPHASGTNHRNGSLVEDGSDDSDDESQHDIVSSLRTITTAPSGTALDTDQKASQSNAYCGFLGLTLAGIVVYGFGLEKMHSIPIGLLGAFVFGVGEGCVMVAARAFVGHEFWGGDGAFAQGVLIAMNNLAMMASKNIVPWLIETRRQESILAGEDNADADHSSIRVGILACCVVQLVALGAGCLYAQRNGGFCAKPRRERAHGHHRHHPGRWERPLPEGGKTDDDECGGHYFRKNALASGRQTLHANKAPSRCERSSFSSMAALVNLPLTFWIVAIGRAIFLVTFKVFSRYSNSFLIEEFDVNAVKAGRISSVNELFALFSPLVGFLAYRSPGGIVGFALLGAVLGTASIGSLAFVPASVVTNHLPGGPLTPLVGISIAHGIIIPISIAMIPHTVPATQLGMAFAVFEVLGSTLNMTDIVFGWLRDTSGNYDIPMQLLFGYALAGMLLLWISRKRIGSIGILGNEGGVR